MTRAKNPVCDAGQLADNLRQMGEIVRQLAPLERQLATTKDRGEILDVRRVAIGAYGLFAKAHASILFQGILQQYQLPVMLRKKIEAGSRFYMRRRFPKVSTVRSLTSLLRAYRTHYEAAKEAVRVGTPHAMCTVSAVREMKAGPFRLINTGGFERPVMERVKAIVEEAAERMKAKGLGAALYGDISVSNTVSKSNVLAFYYPDRDDMFVRANVSHDANVVKTVIHELAHRYDFQVLKNDRAVTDLYWAIEQEDDDAGAARVKAVMGSPAAPKVGDRITSKDAQWEIIQMRPKSGIVVIRPVIAGKVSLRYKPARLSIERYLRIKQGARAATKAGRASKPGRGFVSRYASKSSRENFAEMVAFYCLDVLPQHQVAMLQKLLPKPGKASKAPARVATKPAPPHVAGKTMSSVEVAGTLVTGLGREEAEAFALAEAARHKTAFWVEVYAAILRKAA